MTKQALLTEFIKRTPGILDEFVERLYMATKDSGDPDLSLMTLQDCVDYVYSLTIHRTYDGYVMEKSVVTDGLSKRFPEIRFEESSPHLDHAGDVDYLGRVGGKAFGIQIKPVTARANFAGYSLTERMKASFEDFTEVYGGKVFVIFSLDGEIGNPEVLEQISTEIDHLKQR